MVGTKASMLGFLLLYHDLELLRSGEKKINLGNNPRSGEVKVTPQEVSSGAQGRRRNNIGKSIRSKYSCMAQQVRPRGILL